MSFMRFRNLGQYGVVSDIANTDVPVNAWTDARNVRFDAAKISKIGGNSPLSVTIIGDQTPLAVRKAPLSTGQYFYATDKFVYSVFPNPSYDPNTPGSLPNLRYNVTPRDNTGDAIPSYDVNSDLPVGTKVRHYEVNTDTRWNSTEIAERSVFNCPQYAPIGQKDGSFSVKDALVTIPGWGINTPTTTTPLTWLCESIHAYKDYLLALNMTEATSASPSKTTNISNRVRWSDAAFENQLPQHWYDGEENIDSGFVDLMDATSPIIDGAPLRNYFMVYTNTETYIFNFVGGTSVFENYKVFSDGGLIAKGCVAEYEGWHYCVTQDDVIMHDGSQKSSIIQNVIRDRLLKEISSVNSRATRVFSNPVRKEIWICYPFGQAIDESVWECNRAAVYSIQNKTWTFTDIPDIYDAAMGELIDNTAPLIWQDDVDDWEQSTQPWSIESVVMGNDRLFAASARHGLFILDNGDFDTTITFTSPTAYTTILTPVVRWVERVGIDMDEEVEEIGRVKTWRCVYPQIHGDGEYDWTLGVKSVTGQNYNLRQPTTLTYGTDYKLDCLLTGRYHSLKIQTNAPAEWGLSGYDVDYVVQGRR